MEIIVPEESNDLKSIIKKGVERIFNEVNPIDKIIVVYKSEFERTVIENLSDFEKEELIKLKKSGLIFFQERGITIFPKDNNLKFIVIIQHPKDIKELFMLTLYHEVLHCLDFYNFFVKYGNVHIQPKKQQDSVYYYEFCVWSEFNVKWKSLLLWFTEKAKEDPEGKVVIYYDKKGMIKHINNFFRLISNKEGMDYENKEKSMIKATYYFDYFIRYQFRDYLAYKYLNKIIVGSKFELPKYLMRRIEQVLGKEIYKIENIFFYCDVFEKILPKLPILKEILENVRRNVNRYILNEILTKKHL
ncbi:conserved oligomeric Golgi complex subunit 6 [Candidatus Aminicenantes bacterium AC-708-M15]|jgi:hypothetical protein|nr:conserved oligomeric Golgi complex subunit 6 [SCandidatus Aminicenantes bacterium Aminicenantia_JdfR_composite]MCP2596825.1 conserved oligomeric Golgi complex subunit 6 [Candidatus Aminicenantes bacterium AC-335-G13]MCP2604026.1 conserved oligomeric Golgi complex subunit 6 [Candidatus Aminicenantes bacterium AC-708-M15]MCP2620924.1 conserved oligomeric Golgi complex subunit 6 [Candidatus Aminicenantes bacterium AC-334-E05]